MARIFTAYTPLDPEALQFHSLGGTEEMSRLFDFNLKLVSTDKSIPLNAILGKTATVGIEREDKSIRYLSGYVTEFSMVKRDGRLYVYQARVRPQLYFLSLTKDFRIYQKQTALDIVVQIFQQFGIALKNHCTAYYRNRDYTVQYGESYLDFAMRLMEAEGIAFYFEHSLGEHTLVLCDGISAYSPLPSHAKIPYYPPELAGIPTEEHIAYWSPRREVHAGRYVSRDYDFKNPRASMDLIQPTQSDHAHNNYEVYQYPGGYRQLVDAEKYARLVADELQGSHEQADGDTNVKGLAPGYRFTLTQCPRDDQNREYLVTAATYEFIDNSYEGAGAAKVTVHNTRFSVIPSSGNFRPERLTPQPNISGPDTAVVVGPAGQEIWTDEHGRVKVQFHWDRYGSKDADSSCWVRVSSPLAGGNFGMVAIPRISQEVIIEYPNGDPDHPIITGRFYNADNMAPWGLPGNATQSGILSRSTKDGGYENANALRFEDKKGEEQLWLHAEKDQLTEVENDEKKWVGRDRVKTIDRDETNHIQRDRTETVDRDETITVHGKRTEEVDGNETITIHSNRTERVDLDETISIGKNRTEEVGIDETIRIGRNQQITIGKSQQLGIGEDQQITVGNDRSKTVQNSETTNIGKTKSDTIGTSWSINVGMMKNEMIGMMDNQLVGLVKTVTVGMAKILNVGMSYMQNIGQSMTTNVGKTLRIEAGDSIQIVCGKTKIQMKKDGTFAITGSKINISAVGDNVEINGKNVFLNPQGGASATTPDPSLGGGGADGAGGEGAGGGAPPGASGFVAGESGGMPGGMGGGLPGGMGGLGGLAQQAAGLGKMAGSIPGVAGKAGGALGIVGGLLGGGKPGGGGLPGVGGGLSGAGKTPGISGLGDGSPGNI